MIDEVAAVVGEALTPQADRELVGRPAEVADIQLVLRKPRVQQRLEVSEILHPLGEGVADKHHMVMRPKLEPRRLGGERMRREDDREHPRQWNARAGFHVLYL